MSLNGQGRSSYSRNWLDSVGANVARNGAKYYALVMAYALLACALMANSSETGADPCGGANCDDEPACKEVWCMPAWGGSVRYYNPGQLEGCVQDPSPNCYSSRCFWLYWEGHSNCQGVSPTAGDYYVRSCVQYDPGG